jgi:hypothetical protein
MDLFEFILIALGIVLTYKLLKSATFVDKNKINTAINASVFAGAKSVAQMEEPYFQRIQKAINDNDLASIQAILNELNVERNEILSKDVSHFLEYMKKRENKVN